MLRVVIAAGGTAGHVVPALAVADALRADGAQVTWIGGDRAEARLVAEAGYPLHRIGVEGISRTNPLKAVRALARAGGALRTARGLLRELTPDVVLGGGGYVAGPVGAAAVAARIPLVLTEADSHLGLTNRVLAGRAAKVCLAFPLPGREEPRYVVTGRPVPPPATDRPAARARFGLTGEERCVLIFGGSLGARSINEAALEGLRGRGYRVLHAAGTRDHEALAARLEAARAADGGAADGEAGAAGGPRATAGDGGPGAADGYDLRPYIDGFAEALLACDLCVARSGGSVFEVAAAGRPAILVPYPHAAADHQTGNARWMVEGGAAVLVEDAALTAEHLRGVVEHLLAEPARLSAMASASRALARPDAAAAIAAEVRAAASPGC